MIVLAIETATPSVGCALVGPTGVLASFSAVGGRRHAETLAPAIEFINAAAGVRLGDVGVIAADIGPGLFTGLRVGLATAQALAVGLRIGVVGYSSLDLLASAHRRSGRPMASVVDARRGEVYWALYRGVPGGVQRCTEPAVTPPQQLAAELEARGGEWLAVGDGAVRYAGVLSAGRQVEVVAATPSPAVLGELALPVALREEFVTPAELRPLYLRAADVRIGWASHGAPAAVAPESGVA